MTAGLRSATKSAISSESDIARIAAELTAPAVDVGWESDHSRSDLRDFTPLSERAGWRIAGGAQCITSMVKSSMPMAVSWTNTLATL
jgi:hypothetical protein